MKFVSVAHQAVHTPTGVVLYYVALDDEGRLWWLDSGQPEQQWRPLPPHPEPSNGRRRRRRRR